MKFFAWKLIGLAVVILLAFGVAIPAQAQTLPIEFRINEIMINPPGTDDSYEWIEIIGAASTQLTGLTLVVIDGDSTNAGLIDYGFDLGAFSTGSNGLLLLRDSTSTTLNSPISPSTHIQVLSALTGGSDIENGSASYLLVSGYTGSVNQDLDTDNDGMLDVTPWTTIIDNIALLENDGGVNTAYGSAIFPINATFNPDFLVRQLNDYNVALSAWWVADVAAGAATGGPYFYDITRFAGSPPAIAILTPASYNDVPPYVISITPANNETGYALDQITVQFSEAVTVGINSFEVTCVTGGTRTVTNVTQGGNPLTFIATVDLPTNDSCTAMIVAANVSDTDPWDLPDTLLSNFSVMFSTAGANTPPTITESNFPDDNALSRVINDPFDADPVYNLTVNDTETPITNLVVTAQSSNTAVLPNSALTLTNLGGGQYTLQVGEPIGVGYSDVTVTVTDESNAPASLTLNFAASARPVEFGTDVVTWHTGMADASSAIQVSGAFNAVNDEDQIVRQYPVATSGPPQASTDFTAVLNLTDLSGGLPREVDLEATTRNGNVIYYLGSHSNSSGGSNRPNRSRLFAVDNGAFVGYYANLKADLIAWDQANGHGLGANALGLAASANSGVLPEGVDGFNIEGLAIDPNTGHALVGFRAPMAPASTRNSALIVPVTNFATLVAGTPGTGPALFGAPIFLDLGGRAIRSMECDGSISSFCLILAGNSTATPNFAIYGWSRMGNGDDAPYLIRTLSPPANMSPEGFTFMPPTPWTANTIVQIALDAGDYVYYNDGVIAKDLPLDSFKKFPLWFVELGVNAPTPIPPTATETPLPPTETETPAPATATETPIPPTATETPLPATATKTPSAPTATHTPNPSNVELLRNRSFEDDTDPADGVADFWGIRNGSGERRVCDASLARTGICAFMFIGGGATEDSILQQRVDLAGQSFNAGDVLTLTGFARSSGAPNLRLRVVVNYTDGTIQRVQSRYNTVNATYTALLDPVTNQPLSLTLDRGDVIQIRVLFWSRNSTGRAYFDDISLVQSPSGPRSLIPMP